MSDNLHLQQQKNAADYFLLECEKYEDYLETYIATNDLRFLRDIRFCRKLVELGYRTTEVYTPKQFELQKDILRDQSQPNEGGQVIYGNKLNSNEPLLLELAARERLNYHKIISTIIFLTDRDKNGFEVSGFIDFEASLTHCTLQLGNYTDWEAVFQEKIKLSPKSNDLSYYNFHKGYVRQNNSDNYIVQHDVKLGLNFMHRGDHKKIFADRAVSHSERNYMRSVVYSPKYGYVVLYDHIVRKKM